MDSRGQATSLDETASSEKWGWIEAEAGPLFSDVSSSPVFDRRDLRLELDDLEAQRQALVAEIEEVRQGLARKSDGPPEPGGEIAALVAMVRGQLEEAETDADRLVGELRSEATQEAAQLLIEARQEAAAVEVVLESVMRRGSGDVGREHTRIPNR